MEEIKVGEYVRFDNGIISRVTEVMTAEEYKKQFKQPNRLLSYVRNKYCFDNRSGRWTDATIAKHSPNLIDLIEVGDYVNGKEIEQIVNMDITGYGIEERILFYDLEFPLDREIRCFHNYDIKSIVTHEQFAQIEYKVEE